MNVNDLHGRSVLVTGAGSGIGKATALACARRGADLHLCDLNEAGLAETEALARELGRDVFARRVDVAARDEMRAFAEAVHERVDAVDLLVNNAGVAIGGGFLDTSLEDWDWIVDINLKGVVYGCHFFAPAMVARGRGGHIVNISSLAGYLASEALSAYATTKFAVRGLSEALRDELQRFDIGVTAVCPGIIDTPITSNARLRGAAMERPETREQMISTYRRRGYGPERVAENILKAVGKNRAIAPISLESWVGHYLQRFVPGLVRRLNRRLGERVRRQQAQSQ
ncbi:MAG: SDR family NAD(P)-dependent oxidoreductase [Deltaproteobacteria bacterium]|nr:SDR family NAD(P)-dependent oxidoreductase [Deltaproteobacteria bacterium]